MTAIALRYDENVAELALLEWLGELGWREPHVVWKESTRQLTA